MIGLARGWLRPSLGCRVCRSGVTSRTDFKHDRERAHLVATPIPESGVAVRLAVIEAQGQECPVRRPYCFGLR